MTQNFSLPSLQPPTQFSEFQYTVASTTSFHLSRVSIYRPACFNLPSPRLRVFIYRGFSIYRPPFQSTVASTASFHLSCFFNLPSPPSRVFNLPSRPRVSIYRRDEDFNLPSRSRVFNLPSRSRVFNLPSRPRVFNLPSRPRVFNLPS